jgi:hypothetical protein
MSLARRANVGEKQLERLLAQASGGNNTSLVAAVSLPRLAINVIGDPIFGGHFTCP